MSTTTTSGHRWRAKLLLGCLRSTSQLHDVTLGGQLYAADFGGAFTTISGVVGHGGK